jgi:hypothetical protein
MTPTEQLKADLDRAQWTTVVCGLLAGFSGAALKDFHMWSLLAVPFALSGVAIWWAARVVRLRRELKAQPD